MVGQQAGERGEQAMRLICPSCGAQYEVDADLIPEAGRDVQCSACGHVWFEEPGGSVAAETGEVADEAPATLAEAPPAPVRAPRRTVTPAIAEILREEAEREKAAREAEARAALERQEELPLAAPEVAPADPAPPEVTVAEVAEAVPEPVAPEPEKAEKDDPKQGVEPEAVDEPAALRAMVARAVEDPPPVRPVVPHGVPAAAVRPAEPPPPRPVPPPTVPRRDRLPDIEEINSTLSPGPSGAMSGDAGEPVKQGGRSFRLGFGLVLLVAAGLALVYVYAPRIVAAVPQSEGVMTAYVAAVDEGRLWLDLRLQDLLAAVGGAETAAE